MTKRVVILGGGTGGTLLANRLRRMFPRRHVEITVVDRDDAHVYQPGLLFLPFGVHRPERFVRSRAAQLRPGVHLWLGPVDRVDLAARTVLLDDGDVLRYDVLVVATGVDLLPEETPGLTGPGWMERVFTFYTYDGARALADVLDRFDGGRVVVDVADMPIKCPVAPLEFCFLADEYFRRRGIRDRVSITYATPLDGAFTRPLAAERFAGLLDAKGVELVPEFTVAEVDGAAGRLTAYDGRALDFDLGVVVPLHGGAAYVGRSPGLGDALGFVPTDPHTLQSTVSPHVFALGDATDLTTSKAGSVAHFEGEVLADNIRRFLEGRTLEPAFDGHANCFVETGDGKAVLIDFNDAHEPAPGHFPGPFGLPLLEESRLNHLGKLAFEHVYWHTLLPGRNIPGVSPAMPLAGKRIPREEVTR
jgi:sulfide:quinone oxidoreductase